MKLVKFLFNYNYRIILLGIVFIFLLLIFKDPFSERTLIPNFEPYPDTFYYINPALSLVSGEGFNIHREGRVLRTNVPPLYSFSMIPVFVIKNDPRMSYYTNVLLSLTSLFFLWLILKKIFHNKLIIFFLLILYITNYFIYWVPSIIMAENLVLTLFLAACYFLILKASSKSFVIIPLLAVGIYATKFAAIPITVTIILIFSIKILSDKSKLGYRLRRLAFFLVMTGSFFGLFAIFEQITKSNNVFAQIFGHILLIYESAGKNTGGFGEAAQSSWFGIQYIKENLPLYFNSLIGNPNRFLWDYTPIIPKFLGIGALLGILINLFSREFKFASFTLLAFVIPSVIFMSTFYSFDARYIYMAIPTQLLGFGLFLTVIENRILKQKLTFNILIFIFITIYLITNLTRIKGQISLNLRYAETPWNYIAVLKMNEYFTAEKIMNSRKPVLISALPPYLIDYYSNGNYTLLPLSYEQEFRGQGVRQIVWGPNDYSDLPKLYKKYLSEGFDVYVSRAGLGNEGYTNRDFNTIVEKFDTKLVQPGCYDQCNIYSVKLKEKNGN